MLDQIFCQFLLKEDVADSDRCKFILVFSISVYFSDRKEAAPRFIRKPRNAIAAEGQNTKFDCKIIGASPPIVTW